MNIFQEVTESRMIRQLGQVDGRKLDSLMEQLFEHLLALQVLAIQDPQEARRYVSGIVNNLNFPGFRQSQNDLYNLIVLVMKHSQYSDKIEANMDIVLPEFNLKRNIREIADGRININDYNHMMLMIQRRYPTVGYRQANLRREITDYRALNSKSRRDLVQRLALLMRETQVNSDMYYKLQNLLSKMQ
jgi:type I site-specific restriction-modification system R (restriction) subunit